MKATGEKYPVKCISCGQTRLLAGDLKRAAQRPCRDCANSTRVSSGPAHKGWLGTEHISLQLFHRWQDNAVRRDLCFDLTIEQVECIYTQQRGLCGLTGQVMPLSPKVGESDSRMSLDRHDPSQCYTLDNVHLTCWLPNRIKNNLTTDAFLQLAETMQLHQMRQASWGLVG